MAESRLRDPIKNLEQTAYDLAYYIRHVNQTEFLSIMSEVRKEYGAPRDSWFWFIFYSRARVSKIDSTIEEFRNANRDVKPETPANYAENHASKTSTTTESSPGSTAQVEVSKPKTTMEAVVELLKEGGWEDTSANTKLLERLIKKLHGYNPNFILIERERIILRDLLLEAIEHRIQAENKLKEEELKLDQINQEKLRKEREILNLQLDLLRKQEELIESEKQLTVLKQKQKTTDAEIIKTENTQQDMLKDFQVKLKDIEQEKVERENELRKLNELKQERESELESARQKLLLLNPEFDIKTLSIEEIETIMQEAKKVGEAAVWTYLKEKDEIKRKKEELEKMRGQLAKAKIALAGKTLNGVMAMVPLTKEQEEQAKKEEEERKREQERMEAEKEARRKEVQMECSVREKSRDGNLKSFLETHFKIQMEVRQNKEMQEKSKSLDRGSLKALYNDGSRAQINDARALKDIVNEIDNTAASKLSGSESSATAVQVEETKTEPQKKPRVAFKDMKLRAPETQNPAFMDLFRRMSTKIVPREMVAEPVLPQKPDSDSKSKMDDAKKDFLEQALSCKGIPVRQVDHSGIQTELSSVRSDGVKENGEAQARVEPRKPPKLPPSKWTASRSKSSENNGTVEALMQFTTVFTPQGGPESMPVITLLDQDRQDKKISLTSST